MFKPQILNNKNEHLLKVYKWYLFPQTVSQGSWTVKKKSKTKNYSVYSGF